MGIGEWQPGGEKPPQAIEPQKLAMLVALSQQEKLARLAERLDPDQQKWLGTAMHSGDDAWTQAASNCDEAELVHLIRALVIAEMQIPGCVVGAKSPVIALNRVLKQRGAKLSHDDLAWIKEHSDNRFIPNGPVL